MREDKDIVKKRGEGGESKVCMKQFVWCISVHPEWGSRGCALSYTRVVECWCGRALLLWLGTGVVEGAGTGG